VVAGEDRAHHAAEFFHGQVDRLFGAALGEAAQDLLGLGGAQPQRGGVLDQLVMVVGDQLPVDRPFLDDALQLRPGGRSRLG
jgi:hypothetical protein